MGLRLRFVGALFKRIVSGLPSCIKDITVAWWKDFNNVQSGIINVPVTGLLAFDGLDDYVSFASRPDITQDQVIKFNMYVLNDSGYDTTDIEGEALITIRDSTNGAHFQVSFYDSYFRVILTNSATAIHSSSLSGWTNQFIEVEVRKYFDVFWRIDYVKFNGVTIAKDSTPTGYTGSNLFRIGFGSTPSSYVSNAYVWDLRIYDSSNVLINRWLGYPNGNTDAAWVDQVGVIDGTVNGSPSTVNLVYPTNTSFVEEEIGTRIDTIYYGQYLDATSGQIDFHRGTGTFDYTDPSDGSRVTGVSIPVDGLFTVPANGICDIGVNPDGAFTGSNYSVYESFYPVCERAGTVLHDVLENTFHISVATPSWSESLYGSDFLNQCGFLDKTTSDSLGYTWESEVNGVTISLDDGCLGPIALWHYETLYDVDGEIIYDVDGEIIQVRAND